MVKPDSTVREIERKWLCHDFPPLKHLSEERQTQAYLCLAPVVRVRQVQAAGPARHWLTIKGKGTLSRTEVELPLSAEQYDALVQLAVTPPASKRLRRYALGDGHQLECSWVDEGEGCAFCYAEVEFESEAAAQAFVPPAFLGREVTEEPGCTMAAHCQAKQSPAYTGPAGRLPPTDLAKG